MRALESWVLSYLLNSLWQIPLLFAAGWLAARLVRPLGTLVEHRVWVAVFGLQCLLPAASSCDWSWIQSLLPWGVSASTGTGQITLSIGPGVASSSLPVQGMLFAIVAAVYAGVFIFFALRFAWNLFRLRRLRADSSPLTLSSDQMSCLQSHVPRTDWRNVSIAESSCIYAPLTIGFRHKILLFPQTMVERLSEAEFEAVMAHECAHMRREDFARNLFYELLALPVCYHPLLHMARRSLAATREMVCDEIAAGQNNRNTYAKSLLRVATLLVGSQPIPTPHAIGMFDTNTLEKRVMNLTRKWKSVRGVRQVALLAACAIFGLGLAIGLVAMRTNVQAMAAVSADRANDAGKRLHIGRDEMQANIIHKVQPKYPIEAKKKKIQGTVILDAVINKNGDVENLKATSGPEELRQSAIDAVHQWKYKPYLLNGNPIEVETTIKVTYSLSK